MTEFDFSEITGEEQDDSNKNERKQSNRGHHQVHIKGRWGTTTYTDEEPCCLCGRKPDAVLLIGVKPSGKPETPDDVKHVCDDHEGDIRGDLEYPPELVERHEF